MLISTKFGGGIMCDLFNNFKEFFYTKKMRADWKLNRYDLMIGYSFVRGNIVLIH